MSGYRHDGEINAMDWFCGGGGSSQGIDAVPGVRVTRAANHWDKAIESHALNFPGADHWKGDIRQAPVEKWPTAQIFWASPECFPAGTLILAQRGLIPVQEIRIGDEVFTHRRRWRRVVATMHRPADTVVVKGVGLSKGIETTDEHPFYTRSQTKVWDNEIRRYAKSLSPASQWTEAKDLEGESWATPVDFGNELPVPPVLGRGAVLDEKFWWMVGRWLGDGSLRMKPKIGGGLPVQARRTSQPAASPCIVCGAPARAHGKSTTGRVSPYCSDACKATNKRQNPNRGRFELTIVCGAHEADALAAKLVQFEDMNWQRRELRTAIAFSTAHRGLVEWLAEHFGQHAHAKTVPAWALTLPLGDRRALLDGYVSADGHIAHQTSISTVSKRLAHGIRLLANSVGEVANIAGPFTRKPGRTIEGRPVSERPSWTVTWITGGPQHAFHMDADGYRWAPVREVSATGRRVDVYNITVVDDESYLADGVMVHNCPKWTNARGKKRDFDSAQEELPGFEKPRDPADERSRALMEEVPMYLRGVQERGGLVLAGIVENVIDCRAWVEWDRWLGELHKLGYATKTIALNSMHAQAPTLLRAPQSRDRLYVAYWHRSLGRSPDWNKWLRPAAWCPGCERVVRAMQVFKKPGADMGRYGIRSGQYVYRCPSTSCRNQVVEPEVLPALAAIDWSIPGTPIGDRPRTADAPEGLKPKTIARIRAGLERFAQPVMVPSGGTWRESATPVDLPMPTRTTRENDALVVPPLLIPSEGRDGKEASPAHRPLRTQTARNETGLAWLPPQLGFEPFVTPLRGGGDSERARPLSVPLHAITAGGNHHGLVTPPGISAEELQTLLVPYYGNGNALPATSPVGAFTTRDRWALVQSLADIDIQDVLYRMLEPHEIGRGMAFADDYQLAARSKRDRVRLLGNAVTPPVAELLVSALAETITGIDLEVAA